MSNDLENVVTAMDSVADSSEFDDPSTEINESEREESKGVADEADDDPETIFRRENQAVTIIRLLFLVMFLGVAVGSVVKIYRYMSDSEHNEFTNEYEAVSQTVLNGLISDLNLRLYTASATAQMVGINLDGKQHEPEDLETTIEDLNLVAPVKPWQTTVSHPRFWRATFSALYVSNARLVAYSPILTNETERDEFESYATRYEQKNGPFLQGLHPSCHPCAEPSHSYVNGQQLAEIPGFGTFTCEDIETAMRGGVLQTTTCAFFQDFVPKLGCECGLPPAEEARASWSIDQGIFVVDEDGSATRESALISQDNLEESGDSQVELPEFYSPVWQSTVLAAPQMSTMYDQMSEPVRAKAIRQMVASSGPVMSEIYMRDSSVYTDFLGEPGKLGVSLFFPVQRNNQNGIPGKVLGSIVFDLLWESFLTSRFPPRSDGIHVVVENTCGQYSTFTVDIANNRLLLVGEGDLHDRKFDHMARSSSYDDYQGIIDIVAPKNVKGNSCAYRFSIYPTQAMEDYYVTDDPAIFAGVLAAVYLFTACTFLVYDFLVRRRQAKMMTSATRTNEIVSSLFPQNVRERMYEMQNNRTGGTKGWNGGTTKMQMQGLISGTFQAGGLLEPIADLFPSCTVIFIDIANFTAWSSERGPEQVFMLLENLYIHFDAIAKEMGVFKVETIGDAYMAVVGVPNARRNHAVIMVRFAFRCLQAMSKLMKELELTLGPDTGDLCARFGLHSGPVTAGVLRGEKARFQLFGDTVNTASRIESTGIPNRIHATKATADLITASGRGHWVLPRVEPVYVKGKGEMQTFWIHPQKGEAGTSSVSGGDTVEVGDFDNEARQEQDKMDKMMRLVEWNANVLYELLEEVVFARGSSQPINVAELRAAEDLSIKRDDKQMVLDELTSIIRLPKFDGKQVSKQVSAVKIKPAVKEQLKEYVTQIASMYREVPFHNFEHVSHVIMSAAKMMKRIMKPEDVDYKLDGVKEEDREVEIARQIHESTYGISSNRLMQFTVVFSALIHDVDHTGLTNKELVDMESPVAISYSGKSVAEQNSVDLAWNVLMEARFADLRACIYRDVGEMRRFRQLLVCAVMATDIADKELQSLRKRRWMDAFDEAGSKSSTEVGVADLAELDVDRKATIVYEYIIQASDVSHTMQHWHTFRKFNFKLFEERYVAWQRGVVGATDPSEGWYKGEIGFFDYYIIPLAKKLDRCGVFGVSHDEFLHHAVQNRQEWEQKGEAITKEMLLFCQKKYKDGLQETAL